MPTSAATAELTSLAKILDLANVIIHNVDGRILYWTTGCERLYGWSREEALGEVVHDLLKTKYPLLRSDIVAKLHEEGSWQGEIEHQTKDGSVVAVSSLWVARKSEDDGIHSVLQNNSDITRLKRAQDEIAAREAHLRSILDTVPEAMIVIDMKGSVTSFSAAVTQLFGYSPEEVVGRNVKMLMPEPYRAEHDGYIERYLNTGEARIIGYGRRDTIAKRFAKPCDQCTRRDAARRESGNRYLTNASRCGLRADVPRDTHRSLCTHCRHRYRLRDVGGGASTRFRTVLHDEADRHRNGPRSQHGLWFRQAIGGNIQIYSELERGTSVRVFLPFAEAVQRSGELAPGAAETGVMPRGSETILVVEDDARVRRVTTARLRSLGYQVIEADNGAAALALLDAHPKIAMIFTDVVMPGGMNGDELAEAALSERPGLKVLFTSGYAEPALARQGLGEGAWLKKPYAAGELAEKIREILSQ